MLDPSKRRHKMRIEAALEDFRCPHGETVELIWHPNRPEGWFDIRAHCPDGEEGATDIAAQILRESGIDRRGAALMGERGTRFAASVWPR